MGAPPGEIFVHRNIANMVNALDLSAMSVINYAVVHLKVKHIIVCGHYYCGGVRAAMNAKDLGILNPWLRKIRDVYRMNHDELNAIKDHDAKFNRLVELNVLEQCLSVMKTPEVQLALKANTITIHGWVFDIRKGKLVDLKLDLNSFMDRITEVYCLE